MNKLPWMKYDPDIVALDVEGMTLEEEGAYSRAVRHLWKHGPLPEVRLKRLCGGAFDAVVSCMEEHDGAWSFPWLEEARGAAKAWQSQRSEAGKKSAKKRTTVQRASNDRSTVVLSLSNSNSSSNSDSEDIPERARAKPVTKMTFEEFREAALAVHEQHHILSAEDARAFFDYWTEGHPDTKPRYATKDVFDIAKRMHTWKRNNEGRTTKTAPPQSPTAKPWVM